MLCLENDTVDAMVYDDQRSPRESISRTLKKVYGLGKVLQEDNIFSLRMDLAIHRPKVLVLDYMYEGGLNLNYVAAVLKSFKGIGVIHSSVDVERIEKELGGIPKNFTYVQKGNARRLHDALDKILSPRS